MPKSPKEFPPVSFTRYQWPAYEVFAADLRSRVTGLSVDALALYLVLPAAAWELGNGWCIEIPPARWTDYAPMDLDRGQRALAELAERGLIAWEASSECIVVAVAFLHAYLSRRESNLRKGHRSQRAPTSTESGNPPSGLAGRNSPDNSHRTTSPNARVDSVVISRDGAADNWQPPSPTPSPTPAPSPPQALTTAVQATAGAPNGAPSPTGAGPAGIDSEHLPPSARPGRSPPRIDSAEIEAVIAHYVSYHPKAIPGDKERRLICARRKEGYSPADLCEAIDGCHRSPFHCGVNDRCTKYQSLELIVRDSARVAQFIEIARAPVATGPITHRQSAEDAAEARLLARAGLPPKEHANHDQG